MRYLITLLASLALASSALATAGIPVMEKLYECNVILDKDIVGAQGYDYVTLHCSAFSNGAFAQEYRIWANQTNIGVDVPEDGDYWTKVTGYNDDPNNPGWDNKVQVWTSGWIGAIYVDDSSTYVWPLTHKHTQSQAAGTSVAKTIQTANMITIENNEGGIMNPHIYLYPGASSGWVNVEIPKDTGFPNIGFQHTEHRRQVSRVIVP